eukprot:GHVP01066661.1.p1 GENE.GHVP01066661.1~~GHVP01066661.1.p1  ORF type:complete len:203 (+),score=51.34 GHVP01066661.1:24-611(+)
MGDFDVDYDLDPELDESDFPFSSTPTPPVEGTGLNAVDWKNSSPDKTTKDSPDSFDEELFAPIQPVPETTVTSKGGTEYVMVDGPQPKKEVLENSTSFAALRDWEKSHETTLAARREAAATLGKQQAEAGKKERKRIQKEYFQEVENRKKSNREISNSAPTKSEEFSWVSVKNSIEKFDVIIPERISEVFASFSE